MQSKNAGRTINDIYIGNKKIIIKLSDGSRLDILPFTYTNNYLFKGKELSDKGVNFVKPYVNKTINFFKNLVK